jgi:nickel transport protein
MRNAIACVLLALSMAGATLAEAHGKGFAQRSGQMTLSYGHAADDLDMIRRLDKIRSVGAFDATGAPVPTSVRKTEHLVLVDLSAKPTLLTGVLDNGYWSRQADGKWANQGRDELPDTKESGGFIKYAVRILGPLKAPLGPLPEQVLQIVPVKAALPHHLNEQMTVRVLFNGKPVAGARVVRDYLNDPDAKPMISGKDGTVTFRVRDQGLNVIAASFDAPPDDPAKAAKNGLLASLTFVLEHGPE